jgi:hypothetical protein
LVVDYRGNPVDKTKTGGWLGAGLILGTSIHPSIHHIFIFIPSTSTGTCIYISISIMVLSQYRYIDQSYIPLSHFFFFFLFPSHSKLNDQSYIPSINHILHHFRDGASRKVVCNGNCHEFGDIFGRRHAPVQLTIGKYRHQFHGNSVSSCTSRWFRG